MDNALMIMLAVLCTWVPFRLGQRYGIVRLVSPLHLLSYFCLFGFLIKVIVYAAAPDLAFYRRLVETPWAGLLGALYLSLFILMVCLGYRVACVPSSRGDNIIAARMMASGIGRRRMLFALAVGVAAATMAAIMQARGARFDLAMLSSLNSAKQINVNAEGVGATLAGIKTFFVVPKCAFVLLLAHGIVTRNRGSALHASLLGALLVLVALMSGDRFELVEMLVFALATHFILGGQQSLHAGLLLGLSLVVLGAVSAYMTALRLGIEGSALSGLLRQIVGSTYFLDINAAVMVTDRVRPADMLLGESYLWWTFGWVPRAVWPDKPAIDLGVFFKRDVMQVYSGGAFNVTGPGEAFINFGWAGVGAGFVLGWIYRKGEAALLGAFNTIRHGSAILYPLLFYPFIQASLQSSFSAFIVGAVAQLFLVVALIVFCVTRYRVWLGGADRGRSMLYVG